MPGGRLTNEEREHIGAGLAEGAGFAEIARRLGRPTSTVSREVARNGGAAGYRPDHARAATAARARRRRPTPAGPPADAPAGRDQDAVLAFVERFAALMVHTGMPRMAARVLATLVTTDSASRTAAELVASLRVSPASVSKAIGYLERLELVHRGRDQHRRHERYFIDDGIWLHTWLTSARTNAMWAETAEEGAGIVGRGTPAGVRLRATARFFAQLSADMAGGPTQDTIDDATTVLVALVHAGAPRTAGQLATALGWSTDRVADALHAAERRPDLTDPLLVSPVAAASGGDSDGGGSAYRVVASPHRLTEAQRAALTGPR